MRFCCRFGLVLGLTLCGMSPLGAQQQKPNDPTLPLIPPAAVTQPFVACGTTIFPANAALDAKMPRNSPAGKFSMRVVTPTACRDVSRLPPLRIFQNNLPTILGPKR